MFVSETQSHYFTHYSDSKFGFLDVDFPLGCSVFEAGNYPTEGVSSEQELHTPQEKIRDTECSPRTQITRNIVSHSLQFNQSYRCLEGTANIVNSTPGAQIKVPSTIYKIKKQIPLSFETQYNIYCTTCKRYSMTTGPNVECESCKQTIKRASSKYSVYFPLKPQLLKGIHEHLT